MAENLHSIVDEKIVSQNENELSLSFLIPTTSDFFDGHFPQYKLLPAVAQFDLVTRFAKKYFGTERYVPHINRIKFSAPIRPETTILLVMNRNLNKNTITYTISDANVSGKVYSTGTFEVIKNT